MEFKYKTLYKDLLPKPQNAIIVGMLESAQMSITTHHAPLPSPPLLEVCHAPSPSSPYLAVHQT